MPRTTQHPKESSFNFRVEPTLKAAFTIEAEFSIRRAETRRKLANVKS
jgi:hypothetical protein